MKRITLTLYLIATILFILSAAPIYAIGPRFNFMQNDFKTLRGVNLTSGDSVWRDPISGQTSDQFRGLIYIHNGIVDTTAINTRVKITIPATTTGKTTTITVSVSADNAETITDTLLVTLNDNARLEYLSGTTTWFPTPNGTTTQFPFPGGQTGDEIITSGVNVGDVQGCWQFVQYISFGFRTVPIAPVPEPSSLLALGGGIVGVFGTVIARRKPRHLQSGAKK